MKLVYRSFATRDFDADQTARRYFCQRCAETHFCLRHRKDRRLLPGYSSITNGADGAPEAQEQKNARAGPY
jgi:hypothetical protein